MYLRYFSRAEGRPPAPVVLLGRFEGEKKLPTVLKGLASWLGPTVQQVFESDQFKGEENEWREIAVPGAKVERVFLLGFGKAEKLTADKVRKLAGTAQKRMDAAKIPQYTSFLAACLAAKGEEAVATQTIYQCVAEAMLLAAYLYRGKKTDEPPKRVETAHLFVPKSYETAARHGETIAQSANFARDLVNAPANLMTPTIFVEQARKAAREAGLRVEVWDRARLERENMHLLLGVARGSIEEPRFVILEYGKAVKGRGPLVLVGKGITFDTGGISIKPAANMEQMKYDMSGAAAVVAAMRALALLKVPGHFIALAPLTENMPGGRATKPGDVHLSRDGKSVEIVNTDAEGRLILADALALAKTYKPSAVVDAATLTGACVIALGHVIGLMGNNAALLQAVKEAGEFTGERVWELPMFDEYAEGLKSDVADLKNVTGGRAAGTIIGGKFLEKFTDYPWAHLDIAGAAWEEKDHPYRPKGGTGVGVRLFVELAQNWFR